MREFYKERILFHVREGIRYRDLALKLMGETNKFELEEFEAVLDKLIQDELITELKFTPVDGVIFFFYVLPTTSIAINGMGV